jgi:hypothetical protein
MTYVQVTTKCHARQQFRCDPCHLLTFHRANHERLSDPTKSGVK